MGFLDDLMASATSKMDRFLTAAEERTPNLDQYKAREYSDEEIRPRNLKQGDALIIEHIQNGEQISGTVFSNDRRNELVILVAEGGEQGIVKWGDAKFYDATKGTPKAGVRREDMKDGHIYDGEILDD